MRNNIAYLQMCDKFAREAVMDLPANAPPAKRAELERAATLARQAHARAVSELPKPVIPQ